MEHSSSVDDLVGTFWDESNAAASGLTDKTPSLISGPRSCTPAAPDQWSFQEFLKDNLTAPVVTSGPGPLKLRPACKSRFLIDPARPEHPDDEDDNEEGEDEEEPSSEEPFLRAAELRLSYPVEGALNPLFSGLRNEEKLAPVADPRTVAGGNLVGSYPEEYECFLKHKLEMACAAVAMTRVNSRGARSTGRVAAPPKSHTSGSAQQASKLGKSSIPQTPAKSDVEVGKSRPPTSGSDVSEDEEHDVDATGKAAPGDSKKVKRMLSNRESARRSRRRKQAHLSELELQVAQLRVENTALVQRLQDISHKFQEAAIDNRVLKADCEALRAKVNMAARDLMARHGQAPGGQFILDPSLRYLAMPYEMGQGIASTEPGQYHSVQHHHEGGTSASTLCGLGKMGRTPSMQRVASLEHLQKRIRSGVSCHSPAWNSSYWELESPAMVEQHDI